MRAPAAPRPWLISARIKHGPWRCLVYMWSHGPHWKPEDPLPESGEVKVWPTKETIASTLGVSAETVSRWIKHLTAEGWIRRVGGVWELAVEHPVESWIVATKNRRQAMPISVKRGRRVSGHNSDPQGVNSDPQGVNSDPQGVNSDPQGVNSDPRGGQPRPPGGVNFDPQNIQGTSKEHPKNIQDDVVAAANPHLATPMVAYLELVGKQKSPPAQFSLIPQEHDPPKRDPVVEVVEYFNAQVAALREWAGLPKSRGATITAEYRDLIKRRLREVEGSDDEKLANCKRVIDVQIHEARSFGKCKPTEEDRRRLRQTTGWKYLKITTLFRNSKNFALWLERWSEDGAHELWGQPKRRHDTNYGAADRHGVAEQDIATNLRRVAEANERFKGRPKREDEWF